MWWVVIGREVPPYESTTTPPPITTRHMGELWHKLWHRHNSFKEGVSCGESGCQRLKYDFNRLCNHWSYTCIIYMNQQNSKVQTNNCPFSKPDLNAPYNFWWHSSFLEKYIMDIWVIGRSHSIVRKSVSRWIHSSVREDLYTLKGIPSHLLIIN